MSNSHSALEQIYSLHETQAHRLFSVNSIRSNITRTYKSPDNIFNCFKSIASYSFNEIKIDTKHKTTLARLFAQAWLLKRAGYEIICRFCLPLSLLLDQNYEFDFNQQKIFSDLFSCQANEIEYPKISTHPFSYGERLGIFSELNKLSKLSLPTKFTFALLILESDYIKGFVPRNSRINFKLFLDDFDELEREGLLVTKPTFTELLRSLDSKDLKQFAEKKMLRTFTRREDLIQEIISKVPLNEIQRFVQAHLEIESPILPTMQHLPLLRKFMLAESNRFDVYLEWLAFKLCKMPSVIIPLMANRPRLGDLSLNEKHSEKKYLKKSPKPNFRLGHTAKDVHILKRFWDSKCEEIINQRIFTDSVDEIANYLYYIDAVKELKKFWGNFQWKYTLRELIASKYLDKYHPKDTLMICPGCGHTFREYSVNWYSVQAVKGNIQFCDFCYQKIFTHETYANNTEMSKLSNSMMLDSLLKLSNSLERIPTQEAIRVPPYSTSKQISVGTILLSMPAKSLYKERFGSWLKSLELAGILEGGYIQRARGIQVFAKDGHLCLSLAEKVVDDWLSNHGVSHEKEPKYPFHPEFNPNRLLRADWKVNETLIEYAGLMDNYEYAIKMKRKESLANALKLDVIILNERNLDELDQKLEKLLITQQF